MLILPLAIYNTLISQAKRKLPVEVCGILGGNDCTVTQFYPMTITNCCNRSFLFDPKEKTAVLNDLRSKGDSMLAIYHSRSNMLTLPSERDLRLQLNPDISYVIISFAGEIPIMRSFRIAEDVVAEESVICS